MKKESHLDFFANFLDVFYFLAFSNINFESLGIFSSFLKEIVIAKNVLSIRYLFLSNIFISFKFFVTFISIFSLKVCQINRN